MAFKLLDRARMSVSGAPGAGDITLGGATQGYQSFTQAGISNGDSFSYSLVDGNNWEYGVATYASSGNKLTRTVTKTSAQNSNPLSLSSRAIISACVRAEDIAGATTLAGLVDVQVAPTNSQDGWALTWVDADLKYELAQITYALLPDKPTIPTNGSFHLYQLGDVVMSPGPFTDGYLVAWNSSTSRFVLTPPSAGGGGSSLAVLDNGSSVETAALALNFVNATSISSTSHDVTITLPTGGGGSALAILNNSVSVESATTSINIVNATSITTSSGAVTLTLPTGGGGGAAGIPIFTPPTVAGLAAVTNLNSATLADVTAGIPNMSVVPTAAGSNSNLYCALQAKPSGNFSVVTKANIAYYNPGDGWCGAGVVVHNSGNTNSWYLFAGYPSISRTVFAVKFTGDFASASVVTSNVAVESDLFMHMDYDGTNITMSVSTDGVTKVTIYTETVATFLGAITHCGVGWSGVFAAGVGPVYNFKHYFAGTLGSNGITVT